MLTKILRKPYDFYTLLRNEAFSANVLLCFLQTYLREIY